MKKGFTLIELLAVIVILAIIALIATPIILGIIEDARKGSIEASANGYIDAVEYKIASNEIKNEEIYSTEYYEANQQGYKPNLRIRISTLNYEDEEELEYKKAELFQEEVYLDTQKSAQVQARIEELEELLMEAMETWEELSLS